MSETRRAPKVTIRKHGGDDALSWAVFVDGKVVEDLTGLARRQAAYYRDQVVARYAVRSQQLEANPS